MKKTLKKPMVVFFIISLVFIVAWIALFVVLGLSPIDGKPMMEYFTSFLKDRIDNFMQILTTGEGFVPATDKTWWATYIVYGSLGLFVIGLILGIIFTIKWHRKRYMWYFIATAFVTVSLCEFAAGTLLNPNSYTVLLQNVFTGKGFKYGTYEKPGGILVFSMIMCSFLAFVFTVLTFAFGLSHAKRRLDNQKAALVEAPAEETESPKEDESEAFAMADKADEVKTEEAPVEEAQPASEVAPAYEPMADFMVEPNEVASQPEEIIVEELPVDNDKSKDNNNLNAADLANMIRDVVRDIVRDEMSRAKAEKPEDEKPHRGEESRGTITGASFGGPLVVQYFNGGVQSAPAVTPAPVQPAPVAPAVAPAPVVEHTTVVPVVAPVKPAEPKPAAQPKPAEATDEEKKPIVRIPFHERLFAADKEMQDNYNELKNEFLSYGLKSRVSNSGDTFRLHRKTYCKLTIAGKSLKLYFALDPKAYEGSTIPVQDASNKGVYAEIPLVFKVKSPLSLRRAKQLIQDSVEKDGLEQKEVESVNWVKELKAEMKGK